jgi:hypothetical protein
MDGSIYSFTTTINKLYFFSPIKGAPFLLQDTTGLGFPRTLPSKTALPPWAKRAFWKICSKTGGATSPGLPPNLQFETITENYMHPTASWVKKCYYRWSLIKILYFQKWQSESEYVFKTCNIKKPGGDGQNMQHEMRKECEVLIEKS